MATIEEIRQQLTKAEVEYGKADKNLENFMKEENLEKFEKRWGTEAMKEEKKRLEKEKDVKWALYEDMLCGGGKGNEQIV